MKYVEKTFSVNVGDTQAYLDNWERTFGKKRKRNRKKVVPPKKP